MIVLGYHKSLSGTCSHFASFMVFDAAIYSASMIAMVGCFLDDQETDVKNKTSH